MDDYRYVAAELAYPGTPIAEHVRTGFNRDDRPVRVIITIVPGDRHRIIYEVIAE